MGNAGGTVPIADAASIEGLLRWSMTDKPSLQVKFRLSPAEVSKEALATDVTVFGTFGWSAGTRSDPVCFAETNQE